MSEPPVRLFGTGVLRTAAGEQPIGADRPTQLLALLACRAGWVAREELAEWLWPERPAATARANVRVCLLRARRMAPEPAIEQHADRLRWQPDSDLRRFRQALDDGALDQALALNPAPLLQGLELHLPEPATEWLLFERQRLETLWRDAVRRRLDALHDRPAEADALLHQLLARDGPAGDDEPVPPPPALARRLRGLDGVHRELVGRRLEVQQAQALLAEAGCRVLTVTGPGGIGKSRLAQAVLAAEGERRAGAVWVPFDDVESLDAAAGRIAAAAGWTLQGAADPWTELHRHAAAAGTLLVALDGTERLAGLADALGRWLAACPQLRLLNTSRSRLAIEGEWLLPLEGLPLPDLDETDPEVLRANDAVRLFETRVRALVPGFDLGAEAAAAVALLHAVEGMPLAIELAATWRRVLGLAQVHAELTGSFDLLDAPSVRDRGLRASFERSWTLLAPTEQGLLARLSLLPGPFDLALARQAAEATLPRLGALVEASLLRADGAGRFSMHPLLRQCAAERAEAGACDAQALRDRHLAWVVQWLLQQPEWRGADVKARLEDIERDLPHLQAAWRHALATRRIDAIGRMAAVAARFYAFRGLWSEGLQAMEAAIGAFDGDPAAAPALARLRYGRAQLRYRAGDFAAAQADAQAAHALVVPDDDPATAIDALNLVGSTLRSAGQLAEAEAALTEAADIARRSGRLQDIGRVLGNLALVHKARGDFDAARRLLEESVALQREADNPEGQVLPANNLANLHASLGRWDLALPIFEQTLAVCDRFGLATHRPLLLFNLSRACLALGRVAEARRWFTPALEAARTHGRRAIEASILLHDVPLRLAEGEPGAARAALATACRFAAPLRQPVLDWGCVEAWATWLHASGRTPEAAALLRRMLTEPTLTAERPTLQALLDPMAAAPDTPALATWAARPLADLLHDAAEPG